MRFETGTPLAVGAAIGGILGKNLFSALQSLSEQPQRVGGYQAVCLAIITAATLLYALNRERIKRYHLRNILGCIGVGLVLGIMSSFLGIGGGPINLVVLYFFFSMETKEAAQNSLYCILISQFASLMTSLITWSVPDFHPAWLIGIILGGVGGGMVGRRINKNAYRLNTASHNIMNIGQKFF